MKLLAFDTSTQWLSVACGEGNAWAVRAEMAGQAHSERLLPLIDAVLAESGFSLADLDALAFGAGPGSFTGVRIACGVAQGLALGVDCPLVAVPTLEALAHAAWRIHGAMRVFACLDARMREVYVAAYERVGDPLGRAPRAGQCSRPPRSRCRRTLARGSVPVTASLPIRSSPQRCN